MEHYVSDPLKNQFGLPIQGNVAVRVQNATPGTGVLATIYSDNGVTVKPNPITTDAVGQTDFYAADGLYDLVFTAPSSTQTVIWPAIRIGEKDDISSSQVVVGDLNAATITAALTKAGSTGSVQIPSSYTGTETYTSTVQVDDKRGKPNRQRGYINVLTDCGLKGDGVTDDGAAIQACLDAYPGYGFLFPQTVTHGCSYKSNQTLVPKGTGYQLIGSSGSNYLDGAVAAGHLGGVEICFGAGVTGILHDANNASAGAIRNLTFKGAGGITSLQTPTGLNIPSALPQFTRAITSIQRASNVLTVTIAAAGTSEGLTQQVGSAVKISGVVGDTTMNGLCVVATLAAGGGTATNPRTLTCAQNGADAGPFVTDGSLSVPTTGAGNADGIRICGNFLTLDHIGVVEFERHGINADSTAGNGCTLPFSDDIVLRDSIAIENGGDGFYCKGTDCNAGYLSGNAFYYNFLYGIEDQSSLGNTWVGNQISNNGHLWATATTPATKTIATISRVLTGGSSQVSVVLSVADANIKLGSCVVIAGVTDTSFNTTAGQCFFINSFTDSTHYGYEQPGAPANASSSGGTSRMAKFSEAYLSAGVDDGAVKFGTQGAVWSTALLSNYVEGGQSCKYGATVLNIGGANQLSCLASQDWIGAFISTNGTNAGRASNIGVITNEFDGNMTVAYRSGKTADFNITTQWRDHSNTTGWSSIVTPASGGSFQFFDRSSVRRYYIDATAFRLNSTGTTAVEINKDSGATLGTGGLEVWSGGASPSLYGKITSTGLTLGGTGAFISSTANPASTGTVRLAKTDNVLFRNNANNADITALSLNGSDQVVVGGSAGVVATTSATSAAFISGAANPAGTGALRFARSDGVFWRNQANSADIQMLSVDTSNNLILGLGMSNQVIQAGQSSGSTSFLIPAGNTLNLTETGGPPTSVAGQDVCYSDSTAHAIKCSYNNGSFLAIPQVISSGTSTLTNAAVNTGVCATVVTTAASGVATTDAISWSYASAPTTPDAKLILNVYPTANNVNFLLCNPTAGSLTPTGLVINWRVVR